MMAEDPPSWAKELLQQQKEHGKELKKIKSELHSAHPASRASFNFPAAEIWEEKEALP